MRVFTVHHRAGDRPRTRFVREGASVWAFLFGPLWLLWHGLWLSLIGYLAAVAAAVALPGPWDGWAAVGVQILLGLHARDLQRWTLRRRGFATAGVVAAADEEAAMLRVAAARPALARGLAA